MSSATQELLIVASILLAVGVVVYLAARWMGKSRESVELHSLRRPDAQKQKHTLASYAPLYIVGASVASIVIGAREVALGQSPEKVMCGAAGIAYIWLWRRGTSDGAHSAKLAWVERRARTS